MPISPKPDEPDMHLRISWKDLEFHYAACRTAGTSFLSKWQESHIPCANAIEIRDGALPDRRLPCEETWI